MLFKSSTTVIKISSFPILIISFPVNFLETVGSCSLMNVLIPVAVVLPIATDNLEVTVVTPIVLSPSIFLYNEEEIPLISIIFDNF